MLPLVSWWIGQNHGGAVILLKLKWVAFCQIYRDTKQTLCIYELDIL